MFFTFKKQIVGSILHLIQVNYKPTQSMKNKIIDLAYSYKTDIKKSLF